MSERVIWDKVKASGVHCLRIEGVMNKGWPDFMVQFYTHTLFVESKEREPIKPEQAIWAYKHRIAGGHHVFARKVEAKVLLYDGVHGMKLRKEGWESVQAGSICELNPTALTQSLFDFEFVCCCKNCDPKVYLPNRSEYVQ